MSLSHNQNRMRPAIAEYYNLILTDIRALGYYCWLKNTENGRVPHVVLEIPKEINGEIYFQKYSVCYFHKKKEVRLFNNYGVFDRPQKSWVFDNSLDLRTFLYNNFEERGENLVKYTYTK